MVTYESNPLHKHIRFRCFSPSNPEFIGSLEPEPSSEKERKMITYYIISGEEAVKNKQPELMNQCNQSPNGPIFGVVKIQNLTLFLTIRVKNWVQLTCQCHRFCLNLHILFSFNGLTTNKRNILGTKITLGGVLKISENYQSYSTKHPPLPDMSSKTIQSNGISRSEFKREAWNMGDLVKNEKKNASYLRINEQKNGLEIHPDSTNNTLDVFVRLMQGYISYSLVKFSRTWNTFQPQEPENAHSKGPKKDSHHGKNKSLENRYIKICSSSICIPDINLPTLEIASFFLTAGVNPSEKYSSDWIMDPKFRRKNSNLHLFNHHLHKRFFQAT